MSDKERFECVNESCELDTFTLDDSEAEEFGGVDDDEKRDEIEKLVEEEGFDEMEAINKVLDNQGDNNE